MSDAFIAGWCIAIGVIVLACYWYAGPEAEDTDEVNW